MKSANVHSLLPKGFVADITLVGFPENKNYTVKTHLLFTAVFLSVESYFLFLTVWIRIPKAAEYRSNLDPDPQH